MLYHIRHFSYDFDNATLFNNVDACNYAIKCVDDKHSGYAYQPYSCDDKWAIQVIDDTPHAHKRPSHFSLYLGFAVLS